MNMKKKNKEETTIGSKEYPYCSNQNCEDKECVRRWEYAPWNKLVWREFFEQKNGKCKNKM